MHVLSSIKSNKNEFLNLQALVFKWRHGVYNDIHDYFVVSLKTFRTHFVSVWNLKIVSRNFRSCIIHKYNFRIENFRKTVGITEIRKKPKFATRAVLQSFETYEASLRL